MTPPPFPIAEHVARHAGALRALALELVGDAATADDAVQETWLGALKSPPRHDAAISGWLATLLTNVVRSMRRRQTRRVRREQVAALATGTAAEDHATTLARADVARRLIAEVEALDAVYRDVIWQRFFEDRAPRDIAAARGVPVETVKSRLKRGLATLRERLEQRDGADWRAAFVGAFGLRESSGAAGIATGGVLMATWTKVAAVGAAAAIAAVLWWPRSDATNAVELARSGDATAPIAAAGNGATPASDAVAAENAVTTHRAEAPNAPLGAAPDAQLATIRGRCIDEQGRPLAGVTATASVREPIGDPRVLWELQHGSVPKWEPPRAVTAADGTFELSFTASPFEIGLGLAADAFVTMSGNWPTIAAATTIAVGDVRMRVGATVHGRLADPSGNGVEGVYLRLRKAGDLPISVGAQPGEIVERIPTAQSGVDGAFTFTSPLAPGAFDVEASSATGTVSAARVEARGGDKQYVSLVWTPHPPGDLITMRVVDDRGDPVQRASVAIGRMPEPFAFHPVCATDQFGAASVHRGPGLPAGGVEVRVIKFGFETLFHAGPIAWGTRDVELRLERGAPIDVCVNDADGRAIEDFVLQVVPHARENSSNDFATRERGPFRDGVARTSVASGTWTVAAQFAASTGRLPVFRTVEVARGEPQRVAFVVAPPHERVVRVISGQGVPIVDTRVRLSDPMRGVMSDKTRAHPLRVALMNVNNDVAVLVAEGRTDARGELRVRGPRDRPLALDVLGPGHVVKRIENVSFATNDELVVEVDVGGRVEGRIEPREVIAELKRRAGAHRPFAAIRLFGGGRAGQLPEDMLEPGFPVGDDGAFVITGAPSGLYRVELQYRATANVLGPQWVSATVGAIDVRSGETTAFVGDASLMLPGTLRGRVVGNGAPLPHLVMQTEAQFGAEPKSYLDASRVATVTTDADGRFELTDRAGTYRVRVAINTVLPWYAEESAVVRVGETTEQTFSFFGGKLALKVLDPQGKPAAKVVINVIDEVTKAWGQVMTDDAGACLVDLRAGPVTLRTRPKAYQSQQGYQQLMMTPGGMERLTSLMIELGTATVNAGETTTLELRLPPAFDR